MKIPVNAIGYGLFAASAILAVTALWVDIVRYEMWAPGEITANVAGTLLVFGLLVAYAVAEIRFKPKDDDTEDDANNKMPRQGWLMFAILAGLLWNEFVEYFKVGKTPIDIVEPIQWIGEQKWILPACLIGVIIGAFLMSGWIQGIDRQIRGTNSQKVFTESI